MGLVEALSEQTDAAISGDTSRAEAMLAAQAHTLDTIFNHLARRAALDLGEYLDATDTCMRLALRAQSQFRVTLETLAAVQNPPLVRSVRQANAANGPRQVNNGPAPSRARTADTPQYGLLDATDGERPDIGAAGSGGRGD